MSMIPKGEKPKIPKGSVDLGLGDILKETTGEVPVEVGVTQAEPNDESSFVEQSLESEFEKLCNEGRWSELATLSEKRLSVIGNSDIEAKLWWVKSQIEIGSVPVSILTSPFEEVLSALQMLENPNRFLPLAHGIALNLIKELKSRGNVGDVERLLSYRNFLGLPFSEETTQTPPSDIGLGLPKGGVKPGYIIASSIILVALLSVLGVYYFYNYRSRVTGTPALSLSGVTSQDNTLNIPPLERSQNVSELDAVFYGMDAKRDNRETSQKGEKSESATTLSTTSKSNVSELPTLAPSISTGVPSKRVKERINTQSPRESERPHSPDKSMGIQKFDEPRKFEIISETYVLSRPSMTAAILGRLRPGQRVRAIGKIGYWLKVLSEKNREGFILSQDTEEITE